MNQTISRRRMMAGCGTCLATGAAAPAAGPAPAAETQSGTGCRPFRYCPNTGTIMGHKLPLDEEVALAAKAGYDGIELWTRSISRYVEAGKSLKDPGKRAADLGLAVESAIGFPSWAVDDDGRRAKGMETMRPEMDLVARTGLEKMQAAVAKAGEF